MIINNIKKENQTILVDLFSKYLKNGGKYSHVARVLGISRQLLYQRLKSGHPFSQEQIKKITEIVT